ncbi:MAG: NAD-dependent epimerase/dehydratase family protein [Alphaproteobacteria bacterium]|nr:NAD-dependent epimerase/dehydratase family protein [Alphaproteobacteria bacterium]
MKIFITGAPGYIGGTVAAKLIAAGHQVSGLARDDDKAAAIEARGITPVVGTLDDLDILDAAAREADAVINAASTHHAFAIRTLVGALRGTGKTFIHTSGSSIVADNASGAQSDNIYGEDSPFTPLPEKAIWHAIERDLILPAAQDRVRTVIFCPCMIYGTGQGVRSESIQIPLMVRAAQEAGVSRYIGDGENIWSNVHIDDCADAYLLALEHAPAGSYFYLESGEDTLGDVARAVGRLLGQNAAAQSMSMADAVRAWGPPMSLSLGSNSRLRADKARAMLGWTPKGPPMLDDIENGSYREALNS